MRPLEERLSAWLSDEPREEVPFEDELRPKEPPEECDEPDALCEDEPAKAWLALPDEWLEPPDECDEPPELFDEPDEPPPKPFRPASTVVAEVTMRPVTKRAETISDEAGLNMGVPQGGDTGLANTGAFARHIPCVKSEGLASNSHELERTGG